MSANETGGGKPFVSTQGLEILKGENSGERYLIEGKKGAFKCTSAVGKGLRAFKDEGYATGQKWEPAEG